MKSAPKSKKASTPKSVTPKRKGVNGRDKGKRLEYEVRNAMSAWWGIDFMRTPGIGAFGTIMGQHDLVGDVYCTDPKFPYSIECKNVESWTFESLLKDSKPAIIEFWLQTCRQSYKAGKKPLLCISKARQPVYCLLAVADLPKDFAGKKFVTHLKVSADNWILHTDVAVILLDDLVACDPLQF